MLCKGPLSPAALTPQPPLTPLKPRAPLTPLTPLCAPDSCCTHASNNDLWRAMCGARGWLSHLEQTTFSTVVAEHHGRTKKERKRGVGALILAQKLSTWYASSSSASASASLCLRLISLRLRSPSVSAPSPRLRLLPTIVSAAATGTRSRTSTGSATHGAATPAAS